MYEITIRELVEESNALAQEAEETARELEESTTLLLAASPSSSNHNDNNEDTSADESHLQQPQQDWWRVKLYKQIPEGNWNDCGTGKLTNYYARPTPEANMLYTPENVFRILGEPMLCVRNEDAVLLRTRVLLHDSTDPKKKTAKLKKSHEQKSTPRIHHATQKDEDEVVSSIYII